MFLVSLHSSKTRLLLGGLLLVALVVLSAYLYTRPVIAPTVDTVATTTAVQETTSTVVVEDFAVEPSAAPMALDMKPWKWLSVTYVDGDVVTPIKADAFLVRFNASGAFTAETDCNSISGSYEARNGGLSLGSIASTKMFCEGSQEAEFTALLSDVVAYRFMGGQLMMTTANGAEVTFR